MFRTILPPTAVAVFAVFFGITSISADEKKILKALGEQTRIEFYGTPLTDAIQYLRDLHGISMVIDDRALRAARIEKKAPITVTCNGTLRSALGLILLEHDLTAVMRHDVLVITTTRAARADSRNKHVLAGKGDAKALGRIRSALSDETTMEFIDAPLSEAIAYLQDLHGVPIQLDRAALKIAGLSADTAVTSSLRGISLRSALSICLRSLGLIHVIRFDVILITTPDNADPYVRPKMGEMDSPVTPAVRRIYDALREKTRLEFVETPLSETLQYFQDLHGVPIVIDQKALRDRGVKTDAPVSIALTDVSFGSALALTLDRLNLRYVVRHEVILVTTPAGRFAPGDVARIVREGAPVLKNGQEIGRVRQGARFEVAKVRGKWLAGYVVLNGREQTGWIHHRHVDLPPKAPAE